MTKILRAPWIAALVLFSVYGVADAALTWQGQATQFRYAVETNGGAFAYIPLQYFNFNDQSVDKTYDPGSGQFAELADRADSTVLEFGAQPGEIVVKASAMGPLSNQNPADGIRVQAFTEILPSNLNLGHGVDVSQKVISYINRRFSVDANGTYPVSARLSGNVSFTSFNNGTSYRADYSFANTGVILEEIVDLGGDNVQVIPVPGFPLSIDDKVPAQSVSVDLKKGSTYQLRAVLNLESDLVNFDFPTNSVMGPIPGSYRLGSASAPLVLDVFIAIDSDGDGVPDYLDEFPNDPTEWVDTDKDGIGNNADPDDDNDGMPDIWEIANGLNPLVNDSALDPDGDGASNLEEYQAGTDPQDPNSFPKKAKAMPWNLLLLNE